MLYSVRGKNTLFLQHMELAEKNWYSSWFDTPYYHILYKDRNDEEAREFMQNLVNFISLPPKSSILDLACGKGRHAVYLNELGFEVTGVDLSENSILHAKQFENDNLRFFTHCMCDPLNKKFDAVFNLFTSLGYFEDEEDNLSSIKAIKQELKPGGFGVIDFMNVERVLDQLIPDEVKKVENINFHITRQLRNGYILKNIRFEDEGKTFNYTEKVKALSFQDFLGYFEKAGIELLHTFGNYQLMDYDATTSDRLILIFK
jgi:SAM-dependent methyltransferase